MSPASRASLFLGTWNPQLALWATVMASATPTGNPQGKPWKIITGQAVSISPETDDYQSADKPQGKNIVDAGVSGAYSARRSQEMLQGFWFIESW
jgi:hypothetical protein